MERDRRIEVQAEGSYGRKKLAERPQFALDSMVFDTALRIDTRGSALTFGSFPSLSVLTGDARIKADADSLTIPLNIVLGRLLPQDVGLLSSVTQVDCVPMATTFGQTQESTWQDRIDPVEGKAIPDAQRR
jgi:hypothetical protein